MFDKQFLKGFGSGSPILEVEAIKFQRRFVRLHDQRLAVGESTALGRLEEVIELNSRATFQRAPQLETFAIVAGEADWVNGPDAEGGEVIEDSAGAAVEKLDGSVVLSVGSAIMAPQVFEKSLSCVNNLRLQAGREIVKDHTIYVVDIQDGGNWDWSKGEPPKDNPAYYLRFCKSFSRMGGEMKYVQCDNVAFLHNLLERLRKA